MTQLAPANPVGTWMLDQLPNHLRSDALFCRFVGLFGAVAERTFDHADALPFLADPAITPLAMVQHLTGWMGAEAADRSVPSHRQRERLARLGELIAWRGTRRGLIDLLGVVTGGEVEVEDEGGVFAIGEAPVARHDVESVTVRLTTAGDVPLAHLVDLITDEIPVNCTLELWVAGTRVATEARTLRGRR